MCSLQQTVRPVERCADVAILAIESMVEEGITEQDADRREFEHGTKMHNMIIAVANKWDLIRRTIRQSMQVYKPG